MDIARFVERLAGLPSGLERTDFIQKVRELEREVYELLARESGRAGAPARGLAACALLADWKDAVISALLRRAGEFPPGLAVFAVGGYGRGELSPHSDVDLLLLSRRAPDRRSVSFISELLHGLWDLGYRLGSSARTIAQLVSDAREDLQLLTSLCAARLLAGDARLESAMRTALAPVLAGFRLPYLRRQSAELRAALADPDSSIYRKESNVKTNPGGLRGVQLMQWLNFAFRGESGLAGLRSLLDPQEYERLRAAYDFILSLRNFLHFRTGRREDVLRVEYMAEAAEASDFHGPAEERMNALMRAYRQKADDIVLILLRTMDGFILRHSRRFRRRLWRKRGPEGLELLDGLAFIGPEPDADPVRAFGLAAACARSGCAPSGFLLEHLRRSAARIGTERVRSRELFLAFRELLSLERCHPALQALQLSGFLYEYLSPLKSVRHSIQLNPFHSYTVDQHSLEAVRALESFAELAGLEKDKYALPAELCAKYGNSIWVIKLALLLHDVGKAYPGDHPKNSAELAVEFLEGLPTEQLFKDMIVFLIERHLLLSHAARRGSANQEVVEHLSSEFIGQPFPEEALELLYLVTCADIRATNPGNFSGYTAGMLDALLRRTSRLLAPGPDRAASGAPHLVEDYVHALASDGRPKGLTAFVRALGPRYCMTNAQPEVLLDYWDYAAIPSVWPKIRVTLFNDYLKIKIIAPDRVGLFSLLSGILLLNGADIVRAGIHTYRGVAIDEFIVTGIHGHAMLERKMEQELSLWIAGLRESFSALLGRPDELDRLIADVERSMTAWAPFRRETRVSIRTDGARVLEIELDCGDRPALLYDVTRCLAQMGLNVRNAYIDTRGWDALDSFDAVSDADVDPAAVTRLREAITRAVEGTAERRRD